eukprot:SAG22_NODE_188_length_15821_cov_38.313319_18_plen_157_part_00
MRAAQPATAKTRQRSVVLAAGTALPKAAPFLAVCLSVCLPVCLCACLSVCLPARLCVCLPVSRTEHHQLEIKHRLVEEEKRASGACCGSRTAWKGTVLDRKTVPCGMDGWIVRYTARKGRAAQQGKAVQSKIRFGILQGRARWSVWGGDGGSAPSS